ncbi:hypothetical protein AMR72_08920 [Flavobacterium psychrophilum]|nr:hypothetical protein AMR72_08920 [Flavobacterium psychrophilum]AOE52617.1 hypothetical protein ALW18_08910 [Flavobacterium psychrophilum]
MQTDCTYTIPTAIEIEEGVDIQGDAKIEEVCTANVPGTIVTIDVNPSAVVTPNCVNNAPNNDVAINIAAGVTGNVMYSINGTDYFNSNIFTNVGLTAGTYTAYVKHDNGCVQTTTFTIDAHTPIDATAAVTENVLCFGAATGEITVTAAGGTTPLQYAISPAYVYGPSNVFTGLAAGEYIVRVKDSIGCEFTTSVVTVTEPTAALTAIAVPTNEICIGANDGKITITAQDGTGPYESRIRSTDAFSTDMTYTDLTPGSYTIEVKDANDCTFTIPTTVEIEEGVTLNASLDIQTTCNSNTIGNVVFVLVNPDVQDDVEYALDGGAFQDPLTAEFIDLADGSHTIIVRHENTCEQTLNFTITSPDNITASASATANVLCYGGTGGIIEVTATGGTGTLLYSISDATPPVFADYISSNVFGDLAAGTYTISVMDDNVGCETQLSVTITQPAAALAAKLAHTDEICFDDENGTITVDITGGTEPYQISLNGDVYETVSATHEFTSLPDGTYTVDVKDANDCAIAQFTQVIQNGVNMQPSAVVTPNCVNNAPDNDVVINIATGVTGTVTYSINGTDYFASNIFTNVGLTSGTYTAYVKHANGCVQATTYTIDEHAPIDATAAVTENVLCFGAATGEITVTATGGTTPLEYAISPAYVYGSSNVFTGLEAGTYNVKVKDAISCEVTTTSVTVTQPAAALAATLAHTDEICFDGNDGTLTVNITGGTIPYEVSINGGTYTTATVYTDLTPGSYTVEVKDANDCTISHPCSNRN